MTLRDKDIPEDAKRELERIRAGIKGLGFESDLGISRVIEPDDVELPIRTWRTGGPTALRALLKSPPFAWPPEAIEHMLAGAEEHWGSPGSEDESQAAQ
jgi:hypothetical protein